MLNSNFTKIAFTAILMGSFIFFTSCSENKTQEKQKAEQAVEQESATEKEAAQEEETTNKQMFKKKVDMFARMLTKTKKSPKKNLFNIMKKNLITKIKIKMVT